MMAAKKIAYLVMADMGDFVTDFHLSFEAIQARGYTPEIVAWREPLEWNDYAIVYVAAPWDYPQHATQFGDVLKAIDDSSALLINDLKTLLWNMDKTYLRDLEARSVKIVPTMWYDDFGSISISAIFDDVGADKVVVKPTIGGNAVDTYVLKKPIDALMCQTLSEKFSSRAFMAQPFVDSIQHEGEYSLFFFLGEYSHAIQKIPKRGDFRVQEEHGAEIRPIDPPKGLQLLATNVFQSLKPLPVYGRGDWVRDERGEYQLMELELVEPSLYLRTNGLAASRFARAIDQRFQEFAGK